MSGPPGLAELLSQHPGAVVLIQAATPTEERLIREQIAAAGGPTRDAVSLPPAGSPGARPPAGLLDRDDDTALVPVRVAWLPEERSGARAARFLLGCLIESRNISRCSKWNTEALSKFK